VGSSVNGVILDKKISLNLLRDLGLERCRLKGTHFIAREDREVVTQVPDGFTGLELEAHLHQNV